jgi:ATP/maltotriose-dependent transcriptional regulator MalT
LVGSVERAQQAYSKLRQRFSGAPAAHGAFMLGRIAHDQRNAFAEAARYFSLYLREAPEGAFAREAASRLVEVRTLAGDRDGARAAAARYVELYPAGPYAEKAREVMAGP